MLTRSAIALILVAACGDKAVDKVPDPTPTPAPTPAAPDEHEVMLAAMTGFTDQMCACRDRACVETVNTAMVKYTTEASGKVTPATPPPTATQGDRIAAIGKRYEDCSAKTLAANPAPDAAPEAPTGPLPAACKRFQAAVMAFASCDKMTTPIRKNLFEAYDGIEKTEKMCTDGLAAIAEPATRMGCKLP